MFPSSTKYKKIQKGTRPNKVQKYFSLNFLKFGNLGLISLETGRLTSIHLKTLFQSVNKVLKKTGRIILKVFPQTPITQKPLEIRMGKGKGNVSFWIAKIKPGALLCELSGMNKLFLYKVLRRVQYKIPLLTKIVFN
jgi:large subunit ribosomal protein L16